MPVTQTGKNVESLVTELSEARKQLEGIPGHFQAATGGLLASIRTELTEHRDRFIGVLRAEQNEAAKLRKDNAAQQHRIEELLAELGQARLDLARADRPGPLAGTHQAPGTDPSPAPSPGPAPAIPQPHAADPQDTDVQDDPAATPEPDHLFAKETAVPEIAPAEDNTLPQAGITADQAHQLIELIARLSPGPETPPQQPAVEPPTPTAIEAGGVADLIPAALAWPAHVTTLLKAAAVNTVAIACNPHTWEFLQHQVQDAEHFDKQPTAPQPRSAVQEDPDDNILSGRSVIALLNALRTTVYAGTGQEVETWALAVTCYERIAEVVNATRPAGDGQQLARPRIVLDDLSVKTGGGQH